MKWRLREVLEDEDKIELLQAVLDTFQRCNFYVSQCHNQERGIREMYETLSCRLQTSTSSERHALEGQFSERDVKVQGVPILK